MKNLLRNLSPLVASLVFLFVFLLSTEVYPRTECDPPTEQCGPLMGNSSGTKFCCANTNDDCCSAAACGGIEQ
jgi:hypothetical protein